MSKLNKKLNKIAGVTKSQNQEQSSPEKQAEVLQQLALSTLEANPNVLASLDRVAHLANLVAIGACSYGSEISIGYTIDKTEITSEEWRDLDNLLSALLVHYYEYLCHPAVVWSATMVYVCQQHAKQLPKKQAKQPEQKQPETTKPPQEQKQPEQGNGNGSIYPKPAVPTPVETADSPLSGEAWLRENLENQRTPLPTPPIV